jgi:beta-phosphoglucomutase-like phosphatase (HAD superfamily)
MKITSSTRIQHQNHRGFTQTPPHIHSFGHCRQYPRPLSLHLRPPHASFNGSGSYDSSLDKIGSEYGEGFMQFRLSGEKTHLDVHHLNEKLKVDGAERLRHATMAPDEGFGLIFNLENAIIPTKKVQQAAWNKVAQDEGLKMFEIERPQMLEVPPTRAITDILQWTDNFKRAQELAWLVANAYIELLLSDEMINDPNPGVVEWLELISVRTRVPSCLVSNLDRMTTDTLLDKLKLKHYFIATVTADDDMETKAQKYLSAAIKLKRPPNQCVVFACDNKSIVAAHNATMKAVAVMGAHPVYRLQNADLTIANMSELSVVNIRRLFANKGAEFMDLNQQFIGKPPPRRRMTNSTAEPGSSSDDDEDVFR